MNKTLKEYYKDPEVILDEKNHWYLDRDGFIIDLPSASTLVNQVYPFDYDIIPPDLLKKGKEKGTCVHNRISHYIKARVNIPCIHSVGTHEMEYKWLKTQIKPILETAKEYYSEVSLANELFTGTFDFLYLDKDNNWFLIDFKTTKFLKPENEGLQLALYEYLLASNFKIFNEAMIFWKVFNTKNKKEYIINLNDKTLTETSKITNELKKRKGNK